MESFQDYAGQQIIVLDEFRKGYSIRFGELTQLCNGTYQVPRKNAKSLSCADTTIVVISNLSWFDEIYTGIDCSPLRERFNLVDFVNRGWQKYEKEPEDDI